MNLVSLDSPYTRLAVAALLGAAVGWERTLDYKPAGLRTYALVALGSAAFLVAAGGLTPDSTRVMQGIVTGIGFLGAGTILRGDRTIHGLTSAASIWLAAGLGVLVGCGQYGVAVFLAVLTLAILRVFRVIEDRWRRKHPADPRP